MKIVIIKIIIAIVMTIIIIITITVIITMATIKTLFKCQMYLAILSVLIMDAK